MPIERWDSDDVAVTCNDCGDQLRHRFHNSVDARNSADHAGWLVHGPTYDPAEHLARTFVNTPFYTVDRDGDLVITDRAEYERLLLLWAEYEGITDQEVSEVEEALEKRLEKLADDPVWCGDCWCPKCQKEDN